MTAPAPAARYDAYRQVCAEAAAQIPSAWAWKRDPRYTPILEHVSQAQGVGYLDAIWEEFPQLWNRARAVIQRLAPLNDDLGKAWRVWFPLLEIECSPSNLRYLYHALRIHHDATSWASTSLHVIEVGGGYGGLALYLRHTASLFALPRLRHTIVDVPEAGRLQLAYAKAIGLAIVVHNGLDGVALDEAVTGCDESPAPYAVSCYAFSEFDADTQAWYRDRLVRHCPHGFMVWNGEAAGGVPVYPFVDAPLTLEDERPLTGIGNKVVTW